MVELTDISDNELDDDVDDIDDETLLERITALTEMFPESLRSLSWNAKTLTTTAVKKVYKFSRSALWIVGTSFIVLGMPVIFENEMVKMNEMQQEQQRQMLMGPGGGRGGPPGGPGAAMMGGPPMMGGPSMAGPPMK